MGMFDDFRIIDEDKRFTCTEGHAISECQTKDFDSNMDTYFVIGEQLHMRLASTLPHTSFKTISNAVFLVYETKLKIVTRSVPRAKVYTFCRQCLPVCTLSDTSYVFSDSRVNEHYPWVEFAVKISDGKIISVKRTKESQTRNQLRERLARGGSALLADDDPLVVEYLAKKSDEGEDE